MLFLTAFWVTLALAQPPGAGKGMGPDFDREIAPLLATHCLDCHSKDNPKGKLDLSNRAGLLRGGKSGPGLVQNKPENSPLLDRVMVDEMPPKKPLGPKEKDLLKAWVNAGAPWGSAPDKPIDPFRFTTAGRAGYDWWSLRPPVQANPPKAEAVHPIDQFIQVRLRQEGLAQNPEADKRTLLRRLSFDLIGLPPTPEEMAAFLKDQSSTAYEKQVDRLLASPHYGERWARHWLDVARFGETDGFERNPKRPNAWPYRDWVIRTFNEDMPFDRFARLQIAGDVLEPNKPDAVRATGFLVGGVYNTVLGNAQMKIANRQEEMEDLVGTVGQSFLGLTVHCARCHEHKFDPISMEDYYRMAAALAGVNHGERPMPVPGLAERLATLNQEAKALEAELQKLEEPARKRLLAEIKHNKPNFPDPPKPVLAWDLAKDLIDTELGLALKPQGMVRMTPEGARLGDNAYLKSDIIGQTFREKTLETWVLVDPGSQQGGAPVSLFKASDATFDAIVYAELEKNRWMAGSDFFKRTQSFRATDDQPAKPGDWVHVAITYHPDGTVTGYRNGQSYGQLYKSSGPFTFEAGQGQVLVGCRLEPAGGNKMFTGTVARVRLYDRALNAEEIARSFQHGDSLPGKRAVLEKLKETDRQQHQAITRKLDAVRTELARATGTQGERVYAVVQGPPAETRVLARGDLAKPGKLVTAGGVRAAGLPSGDFGLSLDATDAERRTRLAEWITAETNPLFARVAVNRLWLHHFGAGLVDTPSDFGFNGGLPSHPELLDWLAREFIGQKYSLKAIHKLMVTSATYRQTSSPRKEALAKDADNRLLWRMRKRRLEGEVMRDAMLQAAGVLNRTVGGAGFSDYKVIDTGNGTTYYEPFDSTAPELQRRSIYRFNPRGGETSMLDLFDCPDCATSAPKRNATTTPLQALSLWNGAMALRLAGAQADMARQESKDVSTQIRRIYQGTLNRAPSEMEERLARQLAEQHGLRSVCRALFNSNEFLTVE